jgi:hypothetical protein
MAIESAQQLRSLLNEMSSLNDSDRNFLAGTAYILPDGRLGALYMKIIMDKCRSVEIDQFFRGARARMDQYGDPAGDRVYYHYRPTGNPPPLPPCEPQEYWSCWVSADNPWRPTI